jgi:hypothetical protein
MKPDEPSPGFLGRGSSDRTIAWRKKTSDENMMRAPSEKILDLAQNERRSRHGAAIRLLTVARRPAGLVNSLTNHTGI